MQGEEAHVHRPGRLLAVSLAHDLQGYSRAVLLPHNSHPCTRSRADGSGNPRKPGLGVVLEFGSGAGARGHGASFKDKTLEAVVQDKDKEARRLGSCGFEPFMCLGMFGDAEAV